MATVSKTKDRGRGGGWWVAVACGRWRGGVGGGLLWRFASVAFCWVALLVKKKEGRDGGKERGREKHLTRHIEEKRALNAIKARGEISH